MHSEPDAWLASQNWFIAHTSSPHVHAALLIAEPSVEEHAPPGTKRWIKNCIEWESPRPVLCQWHLLTTRCLGSLRCTIIAEELPCAKSCSGMKQFKLDKGARATRALRASSLASVAELAHRAHVLPASACIAVDRRAIPARTRTSENQAMEEDSQLE